MTPVTLDETGFDRYLSENDMVVIGFVEKESDAADLSDLAKEVSAKHPDAAFAQVSHEHRALFDMFGLKGTGAAIFRKRVGMYLEPGLPAATKLLRLLDGIAALDMQRVQAELEQERSARESLAVHRVCPATRRGKLG